jgi:hypothetical protein
MSALGFEEAEMSSFVLHHRPRRLPSRSNTEPAILPTLFGEGYGLYKTRGSTFFLSLLIHALAIVLLVLSGRVVVTHRHEIHQQVINLVTEVPGSITLADRGPL